MKNSAIFPGLLNLVFFLFDISRLKRFRGPITELLCGELNLACQSFIKELLDKNEWHGFAKLFAEELCWFETEGPKWSQSYDILYKQRFMLYVRVRTNSLFNWSSIKIHT